MKDDHTSSGIHKLERSITLSPLKPNEYRFWVMQARATFDVHKCLGIVLGDEPNPTPTDDDGNVIGPIGKRFKKAIKSWESRYALVREALLKSLQPADLAKISPYQDSAAAIWTRLSDEYGRRLDYEYIRVNSELQRLQKTDDITMDAHITRFNHLLQEAEYNKPTSIPPMKPEAVNLQFLQSLGKDWEIFAIAKGESIRTLSTAELYAEVRARDARNSAPAPAPAPSQPEPAKAFTTRFKNDNGNRNGNRNSHGGKGNNNNNNNNNRNNDGSGGRGRGRGRGRGGNGGRIEKKKSSFDPDKYCRRCQAVGHDIYICWKHAAEQREKQKKNNGGNDENNGSSNSQKYQPSFEHPYSLSTNVLNYTANVTRFIANSSEITPTDDWLIDSAANAFITPYKSDLRFFVEEKIGQVKGFGGKLETAHGKGSVTLTDSAGNRITLKDVCYVPGSQDRIISLMKFRREHSADFHFTGLETFSLTASNGFQINGQSIKDILHAAVSQP